MTVAALFVEKGGVYYGLPDVDPWDEERDARKYAGPWPVVAHPPCGPWGCMAPVNQARYGHKIGDDGGCFESAAYAVGKWGGVLEHPAGSRAFIAYGIAPPAGRGGWQRVLNGGWVTQVNQRCYGHRARKASWLFAIGVELPQLDWSEGPPPEAWISTDRPRAELAAMGLDQLSKSEARATPSAFRDLLLSIARSARPNDGRETARKDRP